VSKELRLPDDWVSARLGELSSSIQYGYTAKAEPEGIGPRFLRITDIQNDAVDWNQVPFCQIDEKDRQKYALGEGDLVFARTGATVGKSYLIRGSVPVSVFASYLIRVRLKDGISPRYVAYFFQAPDYWRQISETQAGIGQPNVNGKKLAQIQIPLAPPSQQQRIVAEIEKQFSRLDEAVANLKRVKVNLKRYKAAVLKSAVEGKLTEEWRKQHPDVEPAVRLLKRVLAERRKIWEESELSKMRARSKTLQDDLWKKRYPEPQRPKGADPQMLPSSWTWVTWDQIGFSQNGRAFPSKAYSSTGVKLLRPSNLNENGRLVWNKKNTRYMPSGWGKSHRDHVIGSHELVINLTAQSLADEFLGRVCLTGPDELCLLNQRIARLKPIMVDSGYLLWMFKSQAFRRFVDQLNTGSLIQHMFTSQLSRFVVPLPPFDEQCEIATEIEARLSVMEQLETTADLSLRRIDGLRQSILRDVFSGVMSGNCKDDDTRRAILTDEMSCEL
jgi:type I restriction enzyme, S subunit